jgi:glutaredoxin
MYLVIGKTNCSACMMTKNILNNKKIEYEYKLLDDLEGDEKQRYLTLAREQGKMSMPFIIRDSKMFTLQEVMQ